MKTLFPWANNIYSLPWKCTFINILKILIKLNLKICTGKENNLNLSEYLVPSVTATAYYVPEFITPEDEKLMLREIENSPTPRLH